ncbi:hypothetical protein ACQ86N_41400 [Puia sp. P3]|uniref:hypothetical protein n=1 Tax=Puia sp. P3 TaxID=3423952 RepID=UPI003D67922C
MNCGVWPVGGWVLGGWSVRGWALGAGLGGCLGRAAAGRGLGAGTVDGGDGGWVRVWGDVWGGLRPGGDWEPGRWMGDRRRPGRGRLAGTVVGGLRWGTKKARLRKARRLLIVPFKTKNL